MCQSCLEVPLALETAVEASITSAYMSEKVKGWGLADSIILSAAKNLRGKVVTGDEHFRDVDEAVFSKD